MNNPEKTFASLEPFITELLSHWDLTENLLAVSFKCDYPQEILEKPKISISRELTPVNTPPKGLAASLSNDTVLTDKLAELKPDIIFTSLPNFSPYQRVPQLEVSALTELGYEPHIYSAFPKYWEDLLIIWKELAKTAGVKEKGKNLADKVKAQLFDWIDNLYDRIKGKKLAILTSINTTFTAAGWWFPDLSRLCSTLYPIPPGKGDKEIALEELASFRPDVIIIAPKEEPFKAVLKKLLPLLTVELWEKMPASKKGTIFVLPESKPLFRPSHRILEGLAVFISCLAGFDSGYIAPRNSFYRLRWLELHRDKFL